MLKVYVSGALSNVQNGEELKDFYERIGLVCRNLGLETYIPHANGTDPVKNPDVSSADVFEIDKSQVVASDLVIAYVGTPSLGVGMELAFADEQAIPIIMMHEENQYVSRLARGTPSVVTEIKFQSYEDGLEQLHNYLEMHVSEGVLKLGSFTSPLHIQILEPPGNAEHQFTIANKSGEIVLEDSSPSPESSEAKFKESLYRLSEQGFRPRTIYVEPFTEKLNAIKSVWPEVEVRYKYS